MTIEMGGPGIPGFGYGNQGNSNQTYQQPRADNDQAPAQATEPAPGIKQPTASAEAQPGNGQAQSQAAHAGAADIPPHDEAEAAEEVARDLGYDLVPGFEVSASDCINRARQIARSLNHATLSSDHLMLALTMDPGARRQLERVGDVAQLRAVAMRKLGKNYDKSDAGDQTPAPTSDLADIGKKARDAAAEREQMVSISDLIGAFPKEDGRLTYGAGESSRAVAVIETIETRVIPGVNNAVTRIENAIVDAVQRQHQSVQSMLSDLSSRQSQEWELRQRAFMDEIRQQVREATNTQVAAALKDLNAAFEKARAETKEPAEEPESTSQVDATGAATTTTSPQSDTSLADPEVKQKSSWPWLTIF